jgi:hypothetical protein
MFFISLDRCGFVHIAFFNSVLPRFVAATAMASGSIALVPFLGFGFLWMQPLNARSQRNETWQAGKNKRKLDTANEKDPNMDPSGFLQCVPTSWRM